MADKAGLGLGYEGGALVFAAGLAVVAAAYFFFTNASRTLLFWTAFLLRRPLGATVGDLLDKPLASGGLASQGRAVYDQHCASCHGGNLEGQPHWRSRLSNGRLPAPPHDASGHTWHHPGQVLFGVVKNGVQASAPAGYESDMPAFGGVIPDAEIWAVLAYIRSTGRATSSASTRHSSKRTATNNEPEVVGRGDNY